MSDILMATIRCVMAVIVNRSYLKFLAFSGYVLFCAKERLPWVKSLLQGNLKIPEFNFSSQGGVRELSIFQGRILWYLCCTGCYSCSQYRGDRNILLQSLLWKLPEVSERTSRISKQGNRHLRRVIWLMTVNVMQHNKIFRNYFLKRKAEGLPFKKAVFATAHKLIKVIFALLIQRTHFKEVCA